MTPSWSNRFCADTSGVSVVEFALVAPIMVATLLGMAEINNLTTSYCKTVTAAQTVADLTTQSATLTTAQAASIVAGAQRTLDPLVSTTANLSVDISSIGFDASGKPYQAWTYHWGKVSTPPLASLVTGMGAANESVVVTVLSYTCTPLIHEIVPQLTFTQTAFSRPRTTLKIAFNGVTG
jgi:Flp pilus assembly protein TadG